MAKKTKNTAREAALADMQAAGVNIDAFLMYELLIERTERCEYLENMIENQDIKK